MLLLILSGIQINSLSNESNDCESSDEYEFIIGKWHTFPIEYEYNYAVPPMIKHAMDRAIQTYDDLFSFDLFIESSTPKLVIEFGKLSPLELGHALIYINDANISSDMGVTTTDPAYVTGQIVNATVTFGTRVNYQEVDFSCDLIQAGAESIIDVKSVAIHELGHVLGLWHVKNLYSTMHSVYRGPFQQTLSDGEVLGLHLLYTDFCIY
ncbi:hypothetical protein LCGC14_0303330 [marine sediment metagenome]|uniref:Peptidase metallopeptidase domain-containing protein n=1 Tax=marine sediment metagenome TaxID=412755 RepID=A0A0F9U6W3_9ZZZZ